MLFYIFCDILVSLYLRSYQYFFVSIILPKDISSLENLLLCLTDYDPVFKDLLQFVSIYYLPLSSNLYLDLPLDKKSSEFDFLHFKKFFQDYKNINPLKMFYNATSNPLFKTRKENFKQDNTRTFIDLGKTQETLNFMKIDKLKLPSLIYHFLTLSINYPRYTKAYMECHTPSFNITWFAYIHLFETYSYLIFNIINITVFYCILNLKWTQKFQFLLFFKPSSFRNYLVYFSKSRLLFLYLSLYFMYIYADFLVFNVGIGNPNFLNWICVLFIIVFMHDEKF